ncbi:MAG: RcnB family protein [Burkholderiales bacterium]
MKPIALKMKYALPLVLAGILAAGPVMADKPAWAGHGKGGRDRNIDQRDGPSAETRGRFDDQHRAAVREYYSEHFRGGRCPPGLAKKHNGCMPPGQAKKWQLGRPLPRDVIYYPVPQPLVVQIGPPPSGYRYVRVAGDILMIAIGTGMVVDAIQDLGR